MNRKGDGQKRKAISALWWVYVVYFLFMRGKFEISDVYNICTYILYIWCNNILHSKVQNPNLYSLARSHLPSSLLSVSQIFPRKSDIKRNGFEVECRSSSHRRWCQPWVCLLSLYLSLYLSPSLLTHTKIICFLFGSRENWMYLRK